MTPAGIVETTTITRLMDAVPDIAAFPTVDELNDSCEQIIAEAGENAARMTRIGTSRLGEPLQAVTVGGGDRHALILGGVHPNEPIGGLTALHLIRSLIGDPGLRDALGYTWHILPCIDPDGMRLNEGWFSGAVNRAEYGRRFYRPAPEEQVVWAFPVAYRDLYFDRVLPETLAMMRLIDDAEPTLLCSLHNGEFGGVFYYLSHEAPELYAALHEMPAHVGLPMHSGEPEAPFVPVLATGIYGAASIERAYQYREGLGLDPTAIQGGTSGGVSGGPVTPSPMPMGPGASPMPMAPAPMPKTPPAPPTPSEVPLIPLAE